MRLFILGELLHPDLFAHNVKGIDQKAPRAAERVNDPITDLRVDQLDHELDDVARSEVFTQPPSECIAQEVFKRLAFHVEGCERQIVILEEPNDSSDRSILEIDLVARIEEPGIARVHLGLLEDLLNNVYAQPLE